MAKQQKAKDMKQELQPAKASGVPAGLMADVMADAGAGREHVTAADMMVPFLRILQSNSPQVVKRGAGYVQGAEPSFFFNSATGEVFDGEAGLVLIPATFQRRYTEWWPRADGEDGSNKKGLVRDWGTDEACLRATTKDKRNRDVTAAGTYISTDLTHYCLLVKADGSYERVVVSLTSTQMGKSRKWNTLMAARQEPRPDGKGTFTPATFYYMYRATTVPESNDQGQWYGWHIAPEGRVLERPNGEELYLAARAFREAVNSGLVRAAPQEPEPEKSDDVPF